VSAAKAAVWGNRFGLSARELVVVISQSATLGDEGIDIGVALPVDAGFEAYVRHHAQSLCRAAFLLTGDRHLAEDLVQAALAKVALRWDRVVAKGEPTPYVRTVIVRTAIAWRRRRWHGEVPTSPLPESAGAEHGASVERRDRLHRALLQVPARQRAALVLRFYEDLSVADTARAMSCSVGTVKSQTAKGLAHLRVLLAEQSSPCDQPGRTKQERER
jgi:RNA polymerase sigma-70 factor (sigma-E family)